ncbi:MAG: GUN4 domain-containing protein [Okeania sp. SIO3B3]|nr:GUN4 domain-containing protein [Okeania sp. SIO3B3]
MSKFGLDSKLEELLSQKEWNKADEETLSVMRRVASQKEEGRLNVESIKNFPCIDICHIDKLWENYSSGKFGFSVQKNIYHNLGLTQEYDEEKWKAFCKQVGWDDAESKNLERSFALSYSLSSVESGHLPYLPLRHYVAVRSLVQRLIECQM